MYFHLIFNIFIVLSLFYIFSNLHYLCIDFCIQRCYTVVVLDRRGRGHRTAQPDAKGSDTNRPAAGNSRRNIILAKHPKPAYSMTVARPVRATPFP